jgi:hypothetical protein
MAWIPGKFRFCLRCGVSYEQQRIREFGTLDREGRSSAMTVIASSVVRALRGVPEDELPISARKLLTFVDNRQDASLQAGHFNDFALRHGGIPDGRPGPGHRFAPSAVTAHRGAAAAGGRGPRARAVVVHARRPASRG